MKNALKSLSFLMVMGAMIFITSCGDDDGGIIIDDGDGGSFSVADGIYFAGIAGSDTTVVNAAVLSSAKVEGPDFGTIERTGHFAGYIYLSAGNYFFLEVEDQSAVTGYGGTVEEVTSDVGGELASYSLVTIAEGGAAISIATDGLYHIIFDSQSDEGIVSQVTSWGLIGSGVYKSACESDGFDADVDFTAASSDATGSSYSLDGVILKDGKIKIRYNDAWKIERRSTIDPDDPYNAANGYVALTNFGGTATALEEGGSDFDIPDGNGTYDVDLAVDENGLISLAFASTGDAPECDFDADNFQWAVLGQAIDQDDLDASGTADGWENDDQNFYYKGNVSGVDTWFGVVTFEGTDGAFKFRANDAWTVNLGGTLASDGTESTLALSGSDIANPGAGTYFITITTDDQGETWKATMVENGWALTGAATPNGWADDDDTNDPVGVDHDMTGNGTVSGVATYSLSLAMTVGEYKIRANDAWDYSLGGDMTGLSADGANLSISEAGTYDFVLSYDGNTYSITATKQ